MPPQPRHRQGRSPVVAWTAAVLALTATLASAADDPVADTSKKSSAIEIAEVKRDAAVDFAKDILPIFRANCIACHNEKDREADLVLETPEAIRKGGESGPAVVAGKSLESLLLRTAARLEKPFMPPKNNKAGANPLTPQELGLLKLWIDQGAKGEGGAISGAAGPIEWHPLPEGLIPIYAVAVTNDGQLAACNRANQIFIYSLPRRQLVTRLSDPALTAKLGHGRPGVAHPDLVQSLAFSPDGKFLASGGYREVKLWQRTDPLVRFTLPSVAHNRVNAIATSPDGKTAAIASDDGAIRLVELPGGKIRAELKGHAGEITSVRFSADGARLISGSTDKSIRVWDVAGATLIARTDAPVAVSSLLELQPKDGSPPQLVSAGGDSVIRRWAMPAAPRDVAGDVPGPIIAIATSPDRKRVVIADASNAIRLVDPDKAKADTVVMSAGASPIRALSFDGSGAQVLCASENGETKLVSLDSKAVVEITGPLGPVTAAALRPDGKQAATAGGDGGRVSLWRLDIPPPRALGPADEAPATVAVVSPNNQLLATAGTVGGKPAVLVRNIATGEFAQKLLGAEGAIGAIAFSPDGARVVGGGADKNARVWTLADGKEVAKFTGHAAPLTSLAFHADNARVVSADAAGAIRLWTAADGKEIRQISGHKSSIGALTLLPKDQLAVTSGESLNVFDLNAGTPVRVTLLGSAATSLAVSQDGARLAVATADKRVRVMNSADGAVQVTLTSPSAVTSLSFTRDARRILIAGEKRATVFSVDEAVALESIGPADVTCAVFAEKPDEPLVARADKTIRATPLRFAGSLAGITKKVTRLIYAKDGSLVLAASEDGNVRAFASADGSAKYAANHGAPVRDVALSPDGAAFASGGDDKLIKLWTTVSGAAAAPKPQLGPFAGSLACLAFSADGKRVIGASTTAEDVRVFDREQGTMLEGYPAHAQPVVALACLDSAKDGGDVLLAAASDKSLRIGRTSLRGQFAAHSGVVTSLALLPAADAVRFLSGSADGTVRQWNLASANPERQFDHGAPVSCVAVRPDGKIIASAGGTFAKLFDAGSGQMTAVLRGTRESAEVAQLAERQLNLANVEANIVKQQSDEAAARQAAETQALAKTNEAKTAAEKVVTEKQTAATAKLAAKDAADAALATAVAAVDAATKAQATADAQVAAAKAASDAANAKQAEFAAASQKLSAESQALVALVAPAKAAVDAAAADAAGKTKVAADAKASSDTAAAASTAAAKASAEAKAAAEKDPTNTALQQAAAAAEKAAADAAANAKSAADAYAAAQKSADESTALAVKATDAHATVQRASDGTSGAAKLAVLALEFAQKSAVEATAAAQKSAAAKAAADQALAQAKANQPTTDAAAKKAAGESAQAQQELSTARGAVASAEQTIVATKASLAHAEQEATERKAAHALATTAAAKAQAELDSARKTAAASDQPTNVVAFAPDNVTVMLAGAEDGVVRAYNSEPSAAGAASEVIRAHHAAVTALAIAPDNTILTGSADRTVKSTDPNPPWTLKATIGTGDEKSPLADRVLSLAFSPDGSLLATGGGVPSRSGELKLWSVATGQLFREFPDAHSDTVYGLSFSGDGKLLASGGADKFAKVWNVQAGTLLRSFEGHTHHVLDVSLRHDGRVLVTCGADNAVKVWNVQTGEQRAANPQFSKFEVTSLSHVGFTDRLLATTGEGNVRLIREGDVGIDRAFDAPGGATFIYAGAATPDGTLVLSGGYDSVLRVRDARDGKVVADLGPPAPPTPTTRPAQ